MSPNLAPAAAPGENFSGADKLNSIGMVGFVFRLAVRRLIRPSPLPDLSADDLVTPHPDRTGPEQLGA